MIKTVKVDSSILYLLVTGAVSINIGHGNKYWYVKRVA
jgi:hypothetical protein